MLGSKLSGGRAMILIPAVKRICVPLCTCAQPQVKQITRTISDAKRRSGPKRDYFGFVSVFSGDLAPLRLDFPQNTHDRGPGWLVRQSASTTLHRVALRCAAPCCAPKYRRNSMPMPLRRKARGPGPRWLPVRRRATSFPDPYHPASATRWSARLLPGGQPRPPAVSSGASARGPCS